MCVNISTLLGSEKAPSKERERNRVMFVLALVALFSDGTV